MTGSNHTDDKFGVIFDMDGVISDTQNMHSEVESQFFRSLNIHIHPNEITARFAGVGDKEMFTTVCAEHGFDHSKEAIEALSKEKWQMILQMVEKFGIKEVPFARELIELLYDQGFVLSVASGSPKSFIDQVIDTLALRKYFSAFVSAEEVLHGKPAPDVFLEAARQSGVSPSRCIIIEDGISGMQAAARAGIPCIGLVNDKNRSYPTKILVSSLKEITVDFISQLQTKKSLETRSRY